MNENDDNGDVSRRYVVAGCRPWNRSIFESRVGGLPGDWTFIGDTKELTSSRIATIRPRYVFFVHWSWKVRAEITTRWECVNFHMTDLPFGRGGSPLQNLILRGFEQTVLTAFRMTDSLDAGPIYAKLPLALHGTAEEILIRATEKAFDIIEEMVRTHPKPIPQRGDVVKFYRRKPSESELPDALSDLKDIFDFIRMLDGNDYPRAFLRFGRFRIEFSRASLYDGVVRADASITLDPESAS